MTTLADMIAQVPNVYAVVDEDREVAAWIIELPDHVLGIFPDGTSTYATDSTRRALEFVNRSEGIDGQLVATAAGPSPAVPSGKSTSCCNHVLS
ncbi:hypothetical protein ACQPZF_39400 [Actinosynnema sp. CS-041913]|uniref:hypothetical protein n=1 Tax=Actinosynnema sp. CS-041913 TaxID=3239917 RepID=UPI003D90CB70